MPQQWQHEDTSILAMPASTLALITVRRTTADLVAVAGEVMRHLHLGPPVRKPDRRGLVDGVPVADRIAKQHVAGAEEHLVVVGVVDRDAAQRAGDDARQAPGRSDVDPAVGDLDAALDRAIARRCPPGTRPIGTTLTSVGTPPISRRDAMLGRELVERFLVRARRRECRAGR